MTIVVILLHQCYNVIYRETWIIMATITVRVSEEEKNIIQTYTNFTNVNISDIVRESILEKIDDNMDLQAIRDYESTKRSDENCSFDEVVKKLGYEKELL